MNGLSDYADGGRLVELANSCRRGGLAGAEVAHIGSGEGGVSVALLKAGARVTAFDEQATDAAAVIRAAKEADLDLGLSAQLECLSIHPDGLPIHSTFGLVVVTNLVRLRNPVRLFGETRRILEDDGLLVVDARPLFHSSQGAMLPSVAAAPFDHLLLTADALAEQVRSRVHDQACADAVLDRFNRLNRLTVEGIQQAVIAAGFWVEAVVLESHPVALPTEMQHRSLTDAAISGLTLAACPWTP